MYIIHNIHSEDVTHCVEVYKSNKALKYNHWSIWSWEKQKTENVMNMFRILSILFVCCIHTTMERD